MESVVHLGNNRDGKATNDHLEVQIETLRRRILELESENEMLRSKLGSDCGTISRFLNSRPSSY
jgi:hypothetical protein